ncbi:MAG: ribonuclease P protein component [Bacilli bacterium]|nr:ribonuclease P protein component [Bacilli bacterium]MBN2696689.1 ribonuclease P protein component [Bacilli bacterium]
MEKAYRIKKSTEIEEIVKLKNNVANNYFVVYYRFNDGNTHFRFAVSVPKKYGSAVQRNQMKRRIREIVRATGFNNQYDFLVIAKTKSVDLGFIEIKDNLLKLFARAKILIEDRTI